MPEVAREGNENAVQSCSINSRRGLELNLRFSASICGDLALLFSVPLCLCGRCCFPLRSPLPLPPSSFLRNLFLFVQYWSIVETQEPRCSNLKRLGRDNRLRS